MAGLDDSLADLDGFGWIPGVQQILDGIHTAQQAATEGRLPLEATQTLLALLGNDGGPDLMEALAHLAVHITNPDTNPALNAIDDDTAKTVQHLGELHAHTIADTPRHHTTEAAGLIDHAATTGRNPA
ncbi:hypothetical protein P1P75_35780 [Streptomyces sp. ID05-39B]|uniref:hypothetical protein n=1 Tax=Streptomyces sp. ID05-39B TaxID=3028664 RepID=UPI0029B8DD57|nr:hypothetical protein [Streptomyces sp. ID05-39B]MDX3531614.1 hypothetical protein [Streptomyces sp. ID05-39B]